MDDDQIREFSEKMSERIASLEDKNDKLLETARRAEGEKRYVETELGRLQKEIRRLKQELDRLKSPPLIIGNIRDILADGRVVVKSSTGPDFIVNAADYITKENLVVGARVALNKQTLAVMGVLPPSLDPIVTGAEIIDKPPVTFDDVGGLEGQMRELREAVEDPLLKPELYRKVGIEPPKGVLLVGPPGTGKTLLAKAVANRTQATFIRFVGSELVQKYIGEGARLVRELFQLAREKSPSIVFIDELDSVGAKRLEIATSGDREVQRTLMQLLAELDGFNPLGEVKIIGATNRPDILDEALLRPGRFVAPMIFTSPRGLKPSSSASSCMSVRWTSRSPDVAISRRFAPTESSSSMNTMEGDFSRASWNSSRTKRAPSPMYFWTNSDPTNRMNVACVRFATAFARSVFPVPGGPTRRTPFGGSIPTLRYRSGLRSGSSTASRSSRI